MTNGRKRRYVIDHDFILSKTMLTLGIILAYLDIVRDKLHSERAR